MVVSVDAGVGSESAVMIGLVRVRVILGLYQGYIRVILGLYKG